MNPIISIVITTHNQERDIVRCLSSLAPADLTDIEVIVSDDCSTDGTEAAVSRFPFARFLKADRWGHAGGARNRGVLAARGKYVWLFDGDDEFIADNIAHLRDFARDSEADVIAFLFRYRFIGGDERPRNPIPTVGIGPEYLPLVDVTPWCKLVKREKYVAAEERVHYQDTDWWFRQADACESLAVVNEEMLVWHLDNPGQSNRALEYAGKNSRRDGKYGVAPYSLGQWIVDSIPQKDGINCHDLADIYALVSRLWKGVLDAKKPEVRDAAKSLLLRVAGRSVCPWK